MDPYRRLTPAAIETLFAFVSLKEDAQQAFNSAMNEYLLSSPTKRRELIEQWQSWLNSARGNRRTG
jgi:hypothetical protein